MTTAIDKPRLCECWLADGTFMCDDAARCFMDAADEELADRLKDGE